MAFTTDASDAFTDTNGTLLIAHTNDNALGGSDVAAWQQQVGSPDWTIQSNQCGNPDASFGPTHIAVLNTADITDGRVTGVAGTNGNGIAVVARFDGVKWYQFGGGSGGSQILYWDGAAFNVLHSGGAAFLPTDNFALVCAGNLLKGYVNGTLTVDTNDPGSNIAAGKSGMYSAGQSNGFDSIKVEIGTASATPTQLIIGTQPAGNQSGVAFPTQPVVNVADAGAATVTTDTSTVSVALITVSGSGTLSGTTTKAAVAGVADFAGLGLKVTGTGSFKLRFTDGSLALADSALFYVGAAELAFTGTPPTDAYTQYVLTPSLTVAVQDGGGTTVGNSTASVTLALTSVSLTSEVELGTFTKSAVAGVATFDDLTFKGEDGASLRLTASSGSLAPASMTFTLHLRSLRVNFTGT